MEASLRIDEGGMGIVEWDAKKSVFEVLMFFADSIGGPQTIDDIIGKKATIENDSIIAKGIIEIDTKKLDEIWFKIIDHKE
jgi:hypothetical protein